MEISIGEGQQTSSCRIVDISETCYIYKGRDYFNIDNLFELDIDVIVYEDTKEYETLLNLINNKASKEAIFKYIASFVFNYLSLEDFLKELEAKENYSIEEGKREGKRELREALKDLLDL